MTRVASDVAQLLVLFALVNCGLRRPGRAASYGSDGGKHANRVRRRVQGATTHWLLSLSLNE